MKIEFDKGVSFTVTVDSMEQAVEAHRLLMEHFAKSNGIAIPKLPKETPEPVVARAPVPRDVGQWTKPRQPMAPKPKAPVDDRYGNRVVRFIMKRLNEQGIECRTQSDLGKVTGLGTRNVNSVALRTNLSMYTLKLFTTHGHVTLDELRGLAREGEICDRMYGPRKKRKSMNAKGNTRIHDGSHERVQQRETGMGAEMAARSN